MIRPQKMTKVRIISPQSYVRNVIEALYDLQILHIVDFKKGEGFDIGQPMKEAAVYSQQLIDIRSAISRLGITGEPVYLRNIKDAQKKFAPINKAFKSTVIKLDSLKAEENRLMEEATNPLANLGITCDRILAYKTLVSFIGTVKVPIEQKISSVTQDYILMQNKLKKHIAFALFVPRTLQEKAKEILNEAGFSEGALPGLKKEDAEAKLTEVRKEIDALQRNLDSLKRHGQFLIDCEFALTQLNEKAEAPLRFGSSRSTFIATGWIPADKAEQLKQNLNKAARKKLHVELLPADDPPTVLHNPKVVDNFEFLLNLYSLPRHYEIDPTILMFITFPLFFGFMLGDVGYGFITLILMLLLERKFASAKPLLRIITIASLASIAFGFVFGEAFGYEFVKHPILNRVHDINTMMLVSVAIGIVHVNLGFVLGFINELKHHGVLQSFFRKGSWVSLQIGIALLGFGYFRHSPMLQLAGGAAVLISVLMIIKGEGMLRIVELPSLVSNILSYTRLYAIGLASVSLASIFNKMASGLFAQGGFFIIFGVLILLVGHTVNLLLGILGPFLHSVRLHYVEFFQKFYEGGGYLYKPFGLLKNKG